MAGVMVVVVILFFISGFLSLYTRQCVDRRQPRIRGRLDLAFAISGGDRRQPHVEPYGLIPDVIESFPTFLYATVKGHMVAREALACAVCLDEFLDNETLRLIPNCNHVLHPTCINPWLASNSTCPVCRANLVSRSEEEEPLFIVVEVPNDDQEHQPNDNDVEAVAAVVESFQSRRMNQNQTTPRSDSNCERFTVRLPEKVQRQLVVNSTLKHARSCVSFGRIGSGRRGYTTRSVRSGGGGRRYLEWQCKRFHSEEEQ